MKANRSSPLPTRGPHDHGPSHRYVVEGLCCTTEARQIEVRLGAHPGVEWIRIDPVGQRLDVVGPIAATDVCRAIAELGMRARPEESSEADRPDRERRVRPMLAASAGVLWLASMVAARSGTSPIAALLALGSVVAGGWYVFPRGYRAARHGALDMNFLMSLAAVGALLIGEYAEAASVMFLFAVAQWLEGRSMDRARGAIRSLMELSPAEATVLRWGGEERIPVEAVRVDEVVVVRPGEKISVDGVIIAGRSAIDQSPITGESVPALKGPGDEVFAGTLNGTGAVEVRSTKPARDTTLARIVRAVEDAQSNRAPSEAFVDRFARLYTPAVVATAVAVAVLPPLMGAGAWGVWIYRALALLIVACPCALVISTPVTVVSALAGAARRGILIKGGLHLENAARATVIAFDKTGTLTEGRPRVLEVVPFGGGEGSSVLALAAAVEERSEHPLAAAVRERARADHIEVRRADRTTSIAGRGVQAVVDGRRALVGSARLFADEGILSHAAEAAVRELEERGRTVMLVGAEDEAGAGGGIRIRGAIAVADRIRPTAAGAIRGLGAAGIRHVAMLTGDNAVTAEAVASCIGADVDVRAGLLPDQKVAAVRELRSRYGPVLMVGDGINDAPALAAADVGVAMGVAGTDVALETADIALMADDLSLLPVLIRHARKAERIIRANIVLALTVKALFVTLAIAGVATLWMAVLADMGASLLVIGNGMRALRTASPR